MRVTHVKKSQRTTRPRHESTKKLRGISAVTSIGSFVPEIIENTKESNCSNINSIASETNNTSLSSKFDETKINRIPTTTTSILRVHQFQSLPPTIEQSHDQQQTIANDIETVSHHIEQVSKCSSSSPTPIHPGQTGTSLCDPDPINAETLSRHSFKTGVNCHSTNQTNSNRSVFDKNENNNRRTSYLTNPTDEKHRRRRFCRSLCPWCSPCCCLFTGLLLSLLLAVLATSIILMTLSKTTTTSTSVTTSTITASTSRTATTVTITSNTCTSSWSSVALFNICVNCPDINSYQQYAYSYIAVATQTRITFSFREDIGFFALDDVSVRNISAPTIELLTNGGFETGNFTPWIYCNPAGSSYAGVIELTSNNFIAEGKTYAAHSGNYYYLDGAVGQADYLSQTFATNIGETYNISFWLYNQGSGSNSNADLIISI